MRKPKPQSARAFTILELAVIVATLTLLAGLLLPALAKSKNRSHIAIDFNNVRQILKAVHLYASENNDFCPHPTWGSVPSGFGGWLYASGAPSATLPPTASPDQLATAVSNQTVYFHRGQLAPYTGHDRDIFECPTDVIMRRSGTFKSWYLARSVKLSSYTFTGAVSGLGAPRQAASTFKLSDFRPTAFLMWEPDETRPFNFNDGSVNQENTSEGVSKRHTSSPGAGLIPENGRAVVGRFGGDVSFVKIRTFATLRSTPPENDLRCGPGYR